MTITITAIEASPDEGQGLARDMPVRWALEEAGLHYTVKLVSLGAMKQPPHRAQHPFGQIPTYREGNIALFESGAIILHIAQQHSGLLPADESASARAITWMFAALTTIEPPIFDLDMIAFTEGDRPWYLERRAMLQERVRSRLTDLSLALGKSDWLEGAFSAGDLLMVSALRRLKGTGIEIEYPTLAAYVARGEARPAFGRAFEAQRAAFIASSGANPPA